MIILAFISLTKKYLPTINTYGILMVIVFSGNSGCSQQVYYI
ncbi:MAG: hypothetical protein ABH869_05685 [Candidatus Omnitrophota bacterium]